MSDLLAKAIRIASEAHEGQQDKGGAPYILHPLRVMAACADTDEKIVAVLHDTIEDTSVTADSLLAEGFPAEVVDAVLALTKNESESYDDFIGRVMGNPLAGRVKIADIRDNLDITRLSILTAADLDRLNKYLRALARLES